MENNHANELPQHIHDDRKGLDYTLHGDFYFPEMAVDHGYPLGKYGMMRVQYLKESIRSCSFSDRIFSALPKGYQKTIPNTPVLSAN